MNIVADVGHLQAELAMLMDDIDGANCGRVDE